MRSVVVSVGSLASASANNICTSQSVAAGAAATINGTLASGGVATTDKPRRVIITSAGNDSGITFTLSGTNWSGNPISETITGANAGAASSVLDYATVTSLVANGATASTITVGTNGVAGSSWVRFDEWANAQVQMQATVSGTVNYTVQTSNDDPNDIAAAAPVAPSVVAWDTTYTPAALVSASTTQTAALVAAPRWARVVVNSGAGSVTATFNQYSVAPR